MTENCGFLQEKGSKHAKIDSDLTPYLKNTFLPLSQKITKKGTLGSSWRFEGLKNEGKIEVHTKVTQKNPKNLILQFLYIQNCHRNFKADTPFQYREEGKEWPLY